MLRIQQVISRKFNEILPAERKAKMRRLAYDNLPVAPRAVLRRKVENEPLFPKQIHTISVIVPIFNVESYLAECLRSIVNQSYTKLEIILVDDGSTDGSAKIAERYAKVDKRIKLIRKKNGGLGAARNTGLRYATGDFIVFSDSDDVVPPNSYREMLKSLETSGSDFVTGSYFRMYEASDYQPPWIERLHQHARHGLQVTDYLDGMANVFAWNKMFRADFISKIDLKFPENIRYEDQYPITRAYLEARAFDVIPDIVFKWRIRFDGSSITQNKHEIGDLRDRVNVIESVHALILEYDAAEVRDAWLAKVLSMDILPYLQETWAVSSSVDVRTLNY